MSSNSKGGMLERKARAILESRGFAVYKTIRQPFQSVDIFGADLLCIREGHRVLAVQVTTKNVGISTKVAAFERWPWPAEHAELQVWQWAGEDPAGLTREEWMATQEFRIRRAPDWALTGEVARLQPPASRI